MGSTSTGDAIRTHRGLQGGFVWDWVDQALVQTLDDGTERLAYGGDFGDEPNDGAFVCDGLVAADRTPHPSLLEFAKVIQPVQIRARRRGTRLLEVMNEHAFVDLAWLRPTWVVHVDGEAIATGELDPLDDRTGRDGAVEIPVPPLDAHGRAAGASHLVVPHARGPAVGARRSRDRVGADRAGRGARGRRTRRARRLRSRATFESLAPTITLWRAPIDNETFGPGHAGRWERLGPPRRGHARSTRPLSSSPTKPARSS